MFAAAFTPVHCGGREIGAHLDGCRMPAVDATTVALAALATAAVATVDVSVDLALRQRPVIGTVTMGPAGWITSDPQTQDPPAAARHPAGRLTPWTAVTSIAWSPMLDTRLAPRRHRPGGGRGC